MKPLKIVLHELDLLLTVHVMQMDKFQLVCFKNNDAYFSRSGLKNRIGHINDKRWTTKNQAF
jgi:hypothetical protein